MDWSAMKAQLGAADITSANTLDEKQAALAGLTGGPGVTVTEASFGGFGLSYLAVHAGVWAFDAMDLEWEAQVFGRERHAWILRFRQGFDFQPVIANLDAYGYSVEELPGGVLRSQPDLKNRLVTLPSGGDIPLYFTTDPAMTNLALFSDGRTVALSLDPRDATAGPDLLRRWLTDGLDDGLDLSLESVARLLDAPSTASLTVGPTICVGYANRSTDPEALAVVADAGPLSAYNALGIGYSRTHDPIGRVVLGYANAAAAEADLDGRRLLADRGFDSHGRPYSEAYFTLRDARIAERSVVIDLAPPDNSARQLIVAAIQREMVFASCSA
jgi:hypothetical protein